MTEHHGLILPREDKETMAEPRTGLRFPQAQCLPPLPPSLAPSQHGELPPLRSHEELKDTGWTGRGAAPPGRTSCQQNEAFAGAAAVSQECIQPQPFQIHAGSG